MSELYNQIKYKLTYYHYLIKDMINSLIIDHNLFDNEIDSLNHMKLDEECLYYKNINIEKITIDNNTLNIINNCIAKIVDRFWYITTYENKSKIQDLIKKLREAISSENETVMKETNEKLQTELMEIGKKIYSQNSENKTNSTSANNSNSDSVIDADFSETK